MEETQQEETTQEQASVEETTKRDIQSEGCPRSKFPTPPEPSVAPVPQLDDEHDVKHLAAAVVFDALTTHNPSLPSIRRIWMLEKEYF